MLRDHDDNDVVSEYLEWNGYADCKWFFSIISGEWNLNVFHMNIRSFSKNFYNYILSLESIKIRLDVISFIRVLIEWGRGGAY